MNSYSSPISVLVGLGVCRISSSLFLDSILIKRAVEKSFFAFATSEYNNLHCKPVKGLKTKVFDDEAVKDAISNDSNILAAEDIKNVNLVVKTLFENRAEWFVESMDHILIQKMNGLTVLMVDIEKSPDDSYNRSVQVDLTVFTYKLATFRLVTYASFALVAIAIKDHFSK